MNNNSSNRIRTFLSLFTSVLLSVALGILVRAFDSSVGTSVGVSVLAFLLMFILFGRWGSSQVQHQVGGRVATQEEFPRLHNAIDGLCLSHGVEAPVLRVLDAPSVNIAVLSTKKENTLVVTSGTFLCLGAVELEGLLALALVRMQEPMLVKEMQKSFWMTIPFARYFIRNTVKTDDVLLLDQKSVALTRFPPGLIGALETADQVGTFVEGSSFTSQLWVLDPTAQLATSGHPPASLRCAALSEL
tara:strand:- start:1252 stop:1986 length:735 start_codon:yes stop_codon:yes gene_type:complete